MDNLWILYTFVYALLKGSREGMKKAALKYSTANEILFFYTLIGWICILPFSASAFSLAPRFIFFSFIKAAVVCAAWYCAFAALKNMSVSLYGIMDLSRMVFSILLGVLVLGEDFTLPKAIGMLLVILGLLLVNLKKDAKTKGMTLPLLIAVLLNCFLNAVSGTMDKVLMQHMESAQLQFWFMLFMTIIYGIVLLLHKEKISLQAVRTNYWIPLLSITLVLGDRFLFEANANPNSQVTLMTIIKQSSVLINVMVGRLFFHEKNILYKTFCALIVIAGILVALL